MEHLQPEAVNASGGMVAPKTAPAIPESVPFAASKRERLGAFAMYALAYCYVDKLFLSPSCEGLWIAAFVLAFIALAEYLHRDTPHSRESWVWLGCLLTVAAAIVLGRCRVWSNDADAWDPGSYAPLFLHIFAVWWALSRSGALLEGESGRLLPFDALNGFVVFPFKHFFLRGRTVCHAASLLRGERKHERAKVETVVLTVVIAAAALGLLAAAVGLLMSADSGFAELLSGFAELFRFDWELDGWALFRLLFSLPVGAYLYGLLAGTLREDKSALRERAKAVGKQMEALRGVPENSWLVLLALFCALYAVFFAVQGRYLFGAFTHTLPEGFIVSEYARRGFFELCKVMAVNFALLWLVSRTSKKGVRGRRALLVLCLVLLAESLLLAVVAFSKLALYIDCFGFTPKRLQSTWLVCVLAFGVLCAVWSLVKGAKTFRTWMYFGAVTLSLLCLY